MHNIWAFKWVSGTYVTPGVGRGGHDSVLQEESQWMWTYVLQKQQNGGYAVGHWLCYNVKKKKKLT